MNQTTNRLKELFGFPILLAPTLFGGCLGIVAGTVIAPLIEKSSILATVEAGAIAGSIALVISIVIIWLIPGGDGHTEWYITVSWLEIGIVLGTLMTLVVMNDVAATGFVSAYIAETIVLCTVGYLGICHIGMAAMAAIAVSSVVFLCWFVAALLIKGAVLFCFDFV